MYPLIGSLGTPELLLILAVVVLLFGASKLPDLARGSGRALRIFKAETKGLMDDDEDETTPKAVATPEQKQLDAAAVEAAHAKKLAEAQALLDAEKLRANDTPA